MSGASNQALFKQIPAVDALLTDPALHDVLDVFPPPLRTELIREELDAVRESLRHGEKTYVRENTVHLPAIVSGISQRVTELLQPSLRPLINGTGIVLHTNFGRAPLSEHALQSIVEVSQGYSNLEYTIAERKRGSRHDHAEAYLCRLLGVEAALVVNNCAAAVLLALTALSRGRETIVSRGELVEIGGSFRIPEVMESAGAILREVGTTNRTHLRDYEGAIGPDTGLLLKAYRSNFELVGFTKEVALEEMVALGNQEDIPTMMDLGCGLMVDLSPFGIHRGTQVSDVVASGVDVTCFSGDKLLGGPQCGILVGKTRWIERLKNHPMTRALRVDKMVLAGLTATLAEYLNGSWQRSIPAHQMLTATAEQLKTSFEAFHECLSRAGCLGGALEVRPIETEGKVGGGTLPTTVLPGIGALLKLSKRSPNELETALRLGNPPIIGRVTEEGVCLDMRTVREDEWEIIASRLTEIMDQTP